MSAKYYSPPRDQLVSAIQDKPISAAFKTGSLAMAAIGMLVFAVGAVMGASRAWQALASAPCLDLGPEECAKPEKVAARRAEATAGYRDSLRDLDLMRGFYSLFGKVF